MNYFTKISLLLLLLFFCFSTPAFSQKKNNVTFPGKLESTVIPIPFINEGFETDQVNVDIITGASTSGNSRAPQGSQRYIRTVYYISPGEMQASGFPISTVNLIGFNYSTAQSIPTTGNFKVYLQNTSDLAYSKPSNVWTNGTDGIIDNMTLSHDNPITIPASSGNFDIPFIGGSPFDYTGGGLYIAFEYQNASNPLSTSNVSFCNTAIANGLKNAFSTTTLPTSVGATFSAFRPYTRLGNGLIDVVQVVQLYTLGKTPTPFGNPTPLSTLVRNNSESPITFDVNLSIFRASDGTVRHTDMYTVTNLAAGATELINFFGWNPTIIETDSIMVSIPAQPGETYTSNNVKKNVQDVNPNSYTYSQGTIPSGGVGFNAPNTGDFVAKFTTNSPNSINQVVVNFVNGGQPFQLGIWDATGAFGTPGTNIYTSPSNTSAPGAYTILVDPPVLVNGDFFVGVRQTGTVNVSFAYQTESPIRASTFYFTSPTGGTTWTDFAPANPFRFMIEPKFALNNDVAATRIDQSGTSYYTSGTSSIPMTGQVTNFGLNANSFDVNRKIYDGLALIYDQTINVSSLESNSIANTTFPDFTTFINGTTYTIVDSTRLGTDQNTANNATTTTFTPNIAKKTLILWSDAASRDSLISQINTYTMDYDVIAAAGFTGSFSSWSSIFYLLASTGNWTAPIRDSLKSYMDNAPLPDGVGEKRTVIFFGNDLGYNNDPIRNTLALPADTLFYRQYLRSKYIGDSWLSSIPTANRNFYGSGPFNSISSDSSSDPFPDFVTPVNGGTGGFHPLTTTGDSVCGVYYSSATYNMFYGTNTYSQYRTKVTTDSPIDIFNAIKNWIVANGGALPVELSSFSAIVNRRDVNLNWATASEMNNSGFNVERKAQESETWNELGFISGNGTTSETKNYSFIDRGLNTGSYSYRLKQVDYNGNFEYFNLSSEVNVGVPDKYDLSQNYPNPFNPTTKINFDLPFDSKVTMKIFDITGREIATLVNEVQTAGYYTVTFDARNIASGMYFYRIIAEGGNQQYVMTKKMVVVK